MGRDRGTRLGLATVLPLLIWSLFACGEDDDGVTSGPGCEEVCSAAASCTEPTSTDQDCSALCGAQRAAYNQTAWSAYAECVTAPACVSLDDCTRQAVAATSEAKVDRFLRDLCEWAVGCAGGVISVSQCQETLRGLGDDDDEEEANRDDASPWDFVRLLRTSKVSCISDCIGDLSCGESDFGGAGVGCAKRCGLTQLGAFGGDEEDGEEDTCEAQHGNCGDHGEIVENQYGGCDCRCDPDYVSFDWVCVPGCQQTGCGEHGQCDETLGQCSCDEGYYPTLDAEGHGCRKIPSFVAIGAAERASCALRDDGAVECWGDTYDDVMDLPEPNQGFVSLAMSGGAIGSSACALREGGEIDCWGGISQPSMQFLSVSLDDDSACGVRPDHSLYCWGFSPYGVLSPSDTAGYRSVTIGDRIGCGIRESGSLYCWGDAKVLETMPEEELTDVEQVCARGGGACIRRSDGSVTCFGFASYAHMPVPEPNSGFSDVTCGDSHACALRADGRPACWGVSVLVGPLEPTEEPPSVYTDLEAGRDYTCGLRDDGTVGCWGRNSYNQAPQNRRASTY